jgi:sec-independent protein translocase protein TatC
MSLGGHLKELRTRFFWSALFIAAGTVAGWYLFDPVFNALQQPIVDVAKEQHITASVNFGTIGGAFDLRIQISVFIGIVISSPFWLYQLWAFVTPALKRNEKRYTIGFLGSAIPLFAAGCYIAWISLPAFVSTLLALTPSGSANLISANEYVLFALRVLLVFGIAFVLPVVLVLLNFMGVITAKNIIHGWRMATFLSAVIAALATPTVDPTSMFVLMIPLLALYFVAAGVAALRDRWKSRQSKIELEA